MRKTIMLVDDHPLYMEGLRYILKTNGIEVIGTAENGRQALVKARVLKPDIIMMDINMPECNGLDALRLIKAEMPDIKVIMLTISEEDEDLFEAVKYGAAGYLLKNTNAKELLDMLAALENDEAPLSPSLASKLLKEFRSMSVNDRKPSQDESEDARSGTLNERQLEVLELIARGHTYKEVGHFLGLTERTVKYHMSRIVEQLHLKNRAQVISYAARMGLVEEKQKE